MRLPVLLLALALMAPPVSAVDWSLSGFGTLGYARSDAPFTFQRSIDRNGSFDRDSVLAGQLDAQLSPQWSATVQLKAAQSIRTDSRWDLTASWAFVGWRPDNDWLLRAGKLRVPLYLYSETLDVGAATDMARLPSELYWITPTSDFTGLYATRNWTRGEREISLDVYSGFADTTLRQWARDGLPPVIQPGAQFRDVHVRATGLVLTARAPASIWRAGLHVSRTHRRDGGSFSVTYPRVDLAPGLGYWQVDNALPGPGIPTVDKITNQLATAGVELQLGDDWRVAGEVGRMRQRDVEIGVDAVIGYLALFKSFDRLTPYVSVNRMLSNSTQRNWVARLSQAELPPFLPGAAQLVALQRTAADFVPAYDQRSIALGASYRLSPGSKLKAEWTRTRIGATSSMADAPPGSTGLRNTSVDVFTVNYSFAF